jgi:TATA-box binding protein (TBP) (component of TFIID and TFIIIB)
MKTYQVTLTKSYLVNVKAKTKEQARRVCEFYTNDIHDISTTENKKKEKFQIENIECTVNETFDCRETETL